MSRHKTVDCGCFTRIDGTQALCRAHRLEADLTYLATAYTDLTLQTSATARGTHTGGGGLGVPVNLTALELAAGWYEDAAGDMQPGIAVSVLGDGRCYGLEPDTRRVLGEPPGRYRRAPGWDGLGVDQRVLDALTWMRAQIPRISGHPECEWLEDMLAEQLHRLCSRARSALEGPRGMAGWDVCPVCGIRDGRFPSGSLLTRPSTSTVIAGERVEQPAESVCLNPACALEDGSPRCWRWDPDFDEWEPVAAPARDWKGRPLPERDTGAMMRLVAESADPGRWADAG